MEKTQNIVWMQRAGLACVLGFALCLTVVMDAEAQRGGGMRGPQLAPEKAEAAWKAQAECVCKDLGVAKRKSGKVVEAYIAARKSHQAAMAQRREGGGGGGGDRRARMLAYREALETERGKLEAALEASLSEEQLPKALATLGLFDRRWDTMVDTLSGFELGNKKMGSAMTLVSAYVVDYGKMRQEAMANQDWQSIRETGRSMKEKLDGELAKVLSEEQAAEWAEKTTMRRRGPGGGR